MQLGKTLVQFSIAFMLSFTRALYFSNHSVTKLTHRFLPIQLPQIFCYWLCSRSSCIHCLENNATCCSCRIPIGFLYLLQLSFYTTPTHIIWVSSIFWGPIGFLWIPKPPELVNTFSIQAFQHLCRSYRIPVGFLYRLNLYHALSMFTILASM